MLSKIVQIFLCCHHPDMEFLSLTPVNAESLPFSFTNIVIPPVNDVTINATVLSI